MRPNISIDMDKKTFLDYYYLKEELVNFCKENNIASNGDKIALTNRIAYFLEYGAILDNFTKKSKKTIIKEINDASVIEENIVCSEVHRAYFIEKIGKSFNFNVRFQKWLKSNPGKTYLEAVKAYYEILEDKEKRPIDKQFKYNTYIRDFFLDNSDHSLNDAISCWKYKKSKSGNNKYEKSDLVILEDKND